MRKVSIKYTLFLIIIKLLLCFSEPGYYEDGKFGIRLENVLIIKEAATQFNFAKKGYLEFEHITWVRLLAFVFLLSCSFIYTYISTNHIVYRFLKFDLLIEHIVGAF